MNVDRLICGLACPFDEPDRNDGHIWSREMLRRFVEIETSLPIKWAHGPLMASTQKSFGGGWFGLVQENVNQIGTATRFALVDGDGWAGMLTLAELDETPWCDQLLHDVDRREITGLSIGGLLLDEGDYADHMLWPVELSLTHEPAFDSARVIGVGAEALARWELLTGERVTAALV